MHRTLHCADGRLSLGNMHNYQHAASYPAFIVSGKPVLPTARLTPNTPLYVSAQAPWILVACNLCRQRHSDLSLTACHIIQAAKFIYISPMPRCSVNHSGLVDVMGLRWDLPEGTEKVRFSFWSAQLHLSMHVYL